MREMEGEEKKESRRAGIGGGSGIVTKRVGERRAFSSQQSYKLFKY
jgi:hypothetical protein